MTNRLSAASSPYLQQHADNPVDWHPWDDTALALAKAEGKPILLSIGYSSCHWCHVMAKESFADPASAAVMNQHFVNIKVDREERPDLDRVYQTALQLINPQGGGWPLTMFLDPETLLPFFGGTYFPKEPRYQLPGFTDLLMRLAEVFTNQPDELAEQGKKLAATLDQMTPPVLDAALSDVEVLAQAREDLSKQYDSQEGGFGNAPKFPMPNVLQRILRHWAYAKRTGQMDKDGLDMVMITLTQMARGGIYDHLGGGFCRYATDRKWMIPHFEKMLYDNAQLLPLYCHALSFGHDDLFHDAVADTVNWLNREMRHSAGGYYAALDADSEGEEGKYYVWRREEVKKLLTDDEYLVIETLYGLDKPANFENKWNLHRYDSWRSVVQRLSMQRPDADEVLQSAKQKLLNYRETRVRPQTDYKVLTAWNGLAIRGLAVAGATLNQPEWIEQAKACADFLREHLWDGHQLYASWTDAADADQGLGVDHTSKAEHPGYLDDYANLLDGLLALLEVSWREEDMAFAVELAQVLLGQFYDIDNGGFYFTAHDHETLIHRPKPTTDEALPAGNGSAAYALLRLGHLTGHTPFLDAAHNTLRWARALMEKVPSAHCGMLHSLEETVHPGELIILRGPPAETAQWREALTDGYTPWRAIYAIPYEGISTLPEFLPKLVSATQQNAVTAYVCSGLQCSLPLDSLDKVKELLS